MADWAALLKPTTRTLVELLLEGPRSLSWLSAETRLTKPSILRHLRSLEDAGLVAREDVRLATGRETRYTLREARLHVDLRPSSASIVSWGAVGEHDPEFPLVDQLPDERTRADVGRALRHVTQALPGWTDEVAFVILFGSLARGQATWKSDIDLLLLLERNAAPLRRRLADAAAEAQMALERSVQLHYSSPASFLAGEKTIDREAAEEGLILHGPRTEGEVWRKMRRYKRFSI